MQTARSTFSVLFYINTSKTKKSGKCPILGRISIDGENTAFSTGLEIMPAEWDSANALATGKTREDADINRRIEKYKIEIGEHYRRILESEGYVTAEILKNALNGMGAEHGSVMREFAVLAEEKRESVGITIEKGTYVKYPVTIRHFKNFLNDKLNVDDIPFGKINLELVESFARYMKIDLGMASISVNGRMKHLRTLVKRALNRGWIRQDPFYGYVREKFVSCRRWLSRDELERVMQVEMDNETLNFTRDIFVFSCFTGICYVDLYKLKHSDIREQEDASMCIFLKRQKTGTDACIPLLPVPLAILERHRDSPFTGWGGKVFRMQTLTCADKHLKTIAKAARIEQRLTFHMGRHTFATTTCLTNGVPMESVSRMLGHRSIYTTQIYADITLLKINGDMTNLAERIEGKYELAETLENKKSNK